MGSKKKRNGWIPFAAALAAAVILAFAADWIMFLCSDPTRTEMEGSAIFTDGREAFRIGGCGIMDNQVIITGEDPQFVVSAYEEEVSSIHILFREPVAQDTDLQVYYAFPGGDFSEPDSVRLTIWSGSVDREIAVPWTNYSYFRFDFEQDVTLEGIYAEREKEITLAYQPHGVRIACFAAAVFALGCMLILSVRAWKETEKETRTRRRDRKAGRKATGMILLCSLFLASTIVFFQPVIALLEDGRETAAGNTWWIQLLCAAGIGLALAGLARLLPARGGKIAAGAFLAVGAAFLAQCMLLNGGKPLGMNDSWPVMLLNVFVWPGIAVIVIALVLDGLRDGEKRTEIAARAAAWILILIQAVNLTVAWTAEDPDVTIHTAHPPVSEPADAEGAGFGDLMGVSLERGVPYLIKDAWKTEE